MIPVSRFTYWSHSTGCRGTACSLRMDLTTYVLRAISNVVWSVDFHTDFVPEFEALNQAVQDELLAHVPVLGDIRPATRAPACGYAKGDHAT